MVSSVHLRLLIFLPEILIPACASCSLAFRTIYSAYKLNKQGKIAAMKLKDACSLHGKLWQTQHIKKHRHHFADKGPSSQSYGFSSSHVPRWELDHKEGWALKNWCFSTMVLENILESLLDSTEIKPVNPKGNQPWIFIGRTEAEAPVLWPLDVKGQVTGKDWGQEKKGETEDEIVEWHHRLNIYEFEQTPGDSEGQGSPACCSPWGHQ